MAFRELEEQIRVLQKKVGDLITRLGSFISSGSDATLNRLRLTNTGDASPSSTGHAFQIGSDSGQNLIIDNNEIIVRTNGAINRIYFEGGINTGGSGSAQDGIGLNLSDSRMNGTHYPYAMAAGGLSITGFTPNSNKSATVTFPIGRFSAPPMVTVTQDTSAPQNAMAASSNPASTSGFTAYGWRGDSVTSLPIQWIAVQMTPTNGAG